jgi:hypothetical protein
VNLYNLIQYILKYYSIDNREDIVWEDIDFFKPWEFSGEMSPILIYRLDRARRISGVPFVITDSFREGPGDESAHNKGKAVDIRCHFSGPRFKILEGLIKAGFNRIGIYDRHIHADVDETRPPEVAWLGKSQ